MGFCCSKEQQIGDDPWIHQPDPPPPPPPSREEPKSERMTDDRPRCPCPNAASTSEACEGRPIAGTGGPLSHFGNVKQLYCRTGFHLILKKTGKIKGTRKPFHKNAALEFTAVRVGEVQIKGTLSGVYLAINQKGKFYTEVDPNEEGTIFVESYLNGWNTYLSRKYAHFGWYLAINKVGKVRAGQKTELHHKSVMFLPRPAYPE